MLQSTGIIISFPLISITIAGAVNDSKKIKGMKKKSGFFGSELSNTANLISSCNSSGRLFSKKHSLSNVIILILIPIYLFYGKWVLRLLIEFLPLGKVPLRKLTSTCKIPYLYEVFVLCLSYASAYTLNNSYKTFARLNKDEIENARNINTNSGNSIGCNNHMVSSCVNFIVCFFSVF